MKWLRWLGAGLLLIGGLLIGVLTRRPKAREGYRRDVESVEANRKLETARADTDHRARVAELEESFAEEMAELEADEPERAAQLRADPGLLARSLLDIARRRRRGD